MSKQYCADQGNGFYQNPIIFGGFGDHTVLKDGKDYWLAFSGGMQERNTLLYHSLDLVNWEPMYYMFPNNEIGFWAADLNKVGDTYYYYVFASTESPHWNHGNVYVSWTKDIRKGGWSKPSVVRANIPSIDPGLVVGEDGKRYMFMSQNMMFPLTDDGLKAAGDYRIAYPDWPIPDDFDVEGQCTESPKLVWHNGWLYLTTAQGGTMGPHTAHMVTSLRSRSVNGPWELNPYNPIKHTYSKKETWARKGHGTLIEGPDGNWYLLYGGYLSEHRNTTEKATLLEPVEWTEDGWWRVKPDSKDDGLIPMPEGGEKVTGLADLSTDFSGPELPIMWMPSGMHCSEERISFNGDGMTLVGKGTDIASSEPIYEKREDVNFEIICELKADWHAAAGICIAGHGIAVWQDKIMVMSDGTAHWEVREHWHINKQASWSGNHIFLKLRSLDDIVTSWYSYDNEHWTKINICYDSSIPGSRHFFHTFPGIFCARDGVATFRSFTYKSLDRE